MTPEDRAALREAASRLQAIGDSPVLLPDGIDRWTEAIDRWTEAAAVFRAKTQPAAVLALLDAADERDRLRAENERLREALREIARLRELVAHDLQGRVEGGKVSAVYRIARDARAALEVAAEAVRVSLNRPGVSCPEQVCEMRPCPCSNDAAAAAIAAFLEAMPVEMLDTVPDVGYMNAVACRIAWLAAVRRAAGGG